MPIRLLPWVRAFAEAAMVGGLADWFAVTALFRHPLGLPIPHTAIIPANKDRIGDSLATFLKENFLTPGVVARRLEEVDMAAAAARWLKSPPAAEAPARPRRAARRACRSRTAGWRRCSPASSKRSTRRPSAISSAKPRPKN